MLGPRTPKESEFESLVTFLNQNLRQNVSSPIQHEYPTALVLNNIHNMSIITDEETSQIVSHALVKPLVMKSPHTVFKIGAIGSVVTSPDFRNRGLSTQNIHRCLDMARTQNCEMVILWTDKYDYYKKFGFETAGFEYTYQVSPLSTNSNINTDLKFLKTNKVDPSALLRLYSQHTVGCVRTVEDFQKFLTIPNTNVYTAWSKENQLLGYAIEGKGIDLQGFIHDWAGGTSTLLDLLNFIVTTENRPITMMVPRHSTNLRKQLNLKADFEHEGILGLIKITDVESVCNKVKAAFRAEGFDRIVLEKQGHGILFGYNTDLYTLDNQADLSRLLFGPITPSTLEFMKPETQRILGTLLPLPLWVWGWDSI